MAQWTLNATGTCDDADEATLARRLAAVLGTAKYGTAASQLTCSTHNGPLHTDGAVTPAGDGDGDGETAAAVPGTDRGPGGSAGTVPPEAAEAGGTARSKDGSAGAVPDEASRAE